MNYCTRCIYPENHPLNITFDDEGVCSGCRIHEEKDSLDWDGRFGYLRKIVDDYRATSRTIHDCIVPVSGARDSYFIVHVVKNLLGLRPLLVTYNKQYNTQVGIRNLAYLRSLFGCDLMTMTVSPERVKRITRETIRLRGSIYWHCIAGQTVFPVQIAVKFKIPLIIWGAHQGLDQVGMFSHLDEVEMTRKYRQEHDLMNLDSDELLKQSVDLRYQDLEQYQYPHDKEIEAIGVRGIYLNNYIRWDSKSQHELMIRCFGYETDRQHRTFDTYSDVDCFHYSGLHDYIKFLKWGYGKVTDHACREIRLRRISREQAIEMVSRYQDVSPPDLSMFINWIQMSAPDVFASVDSFRDQRIWMRNGSGDWGLRDSVQNHVDDNRGGSVRLKVEGDCEFRVTKPKSRNESNDRYTLIGRGWVDDWGPPTVAKSP